MDPAALRDDLLHHLQREGYLRSPRVAEAMRRVPREVFLPPGAASDAYIDRPLDIGQGQTISAPHMVAMMCEALDLQPGQRVLEIGAGSGYHAAVVSELVQPAGKVRSIERFPDLAVQARVNLRHAGFGDDRIEVIVGDGSEGWPGAAPYDRIYLTCAAPAVPPPLLAQLGWEGKLLAPLGDRRQQTLTLLEDTEQGLRHTELGGCVFVPLLGKHGFATAPRV